MKQLTQSAQQCLDKYLDEVRLCLKGVKSVDSDEIMRDINEHIEQELVSADEPVSSTELETVLRRLGNPQQWTPDEELSWYREMLLRLRTGPDDWRLGYITIGVFVLACITGPGAFLLLPLSYYLARVTLNVSGGPQQLGNQKYLIYPPLACIYLLFTIAVLSVPFSLIGIADGFERELSNKLAVTNYPYWIFVWFVVLIIAGTWWLVVGILSRRIAKKIYYPFPEGLARAIPLMVCIIGMMLIVGGLTMKFFWDF